MINQHCIYHEILSTSRCTACKFANISYLQTFQCPYCNRILQVSFFCDTLRMWFFHLPCHHEGHYPLKSWFHVLLYVVCHHGIQTFTTSHGVFYIALEPEYQLREHAVGSFMLYIHHAFGHPEQLYYSLSKTDTVAIQRCTRFVK